MNGPFPPSSHRGLPPGPSRGKFSGFGAFGVLFFIALLVGTGCTALPRSAVPTDYPGPSRLLAPVPYSTSQIRERLLDQFKAWKGTGYRLGGMSRRGIDCSGFVYVTFRDRLGIRLPRTTAHLARTGKRISRAAIVPGDLVMFKTGWYSRHVGIYIGDFRFIHASKSDGVTISSLHKGYWARRFWMARRVAFPAGSGGG